METVVSSWFTNNYFDNLIENLTFSKNYLPICKIMVHELTKTQVIAALLAVFKEVQESTGEEKEVIITSRPGQDFEYIDSQILLAVTGALAAELNIDIPKKCQLFLGKNNEQLTVEEAAEKLLTLNLPNGSR